MTAGGAKSWTIFPLPDTAFSAMPPRSTRPTAKKSLCRGSRRAGSPPLPCHGSAGVVGLCGWWLKASASLHPGSIPRICAIESCRGYQVIPQGVSQPSLVLAFLDWRDVNVVRGEEVLCLLSELRLHVVQRKPLSTADPSTVAKQRSRPVVHVEVNRPIMAEENGISMYFETPARRSDAVALSLSMP